MRPVFVAYGNEPPPVSWHVRPSKPAPAVSNAGAQGGGYRESDNLQRNIDQIGRMPGLGFIKQLTAGRALDNPSLKAAFDVWDYKAQALTPTGAALVKLAVSAGLNLAGANTAISSRITEALGTGVPATTTSEAFKAALNALAQRSAVASINQHGDVYKIINELVSDESIRGILGAMATAGLTQGALTASLVPDVEKGDGSDVNLATNSGRALIRNIIAAAIQIGVATTLGGKPFSPTLTAALYGIARDTLGAVLASEIASIAEVRNIPAGAIQKVVTQARVGAAAQGVASGEQLAGAIGAGISELLGGPIEQVISDPDSQTAVLSYIAATAAALTGGTDKAVNAAAGAAANVEGYDAPPALTLTTAG